MQLQSFTNHDTVIQQLYQPTPWYCQFKWLSCQLLLFVGRCSIV